MMRIPDDAFARVGLVADSEDTRAFADSLEEAVAAARTELGPASTPISWASLAVNRLLGSLSRCELGGLVEAFGLGEVVFAHDDPGDPADPTRSVLRHLLRGRLVDLLRLSAGQPPFWCWDARSPEAG